MICIKCFGKTTDVINSRPHKNQPSVWRRRKCTKCDSIFTTIERPALIENRKVSLPNNKAEKFNLGKLIISISKAFAHDERKATYDSIWLAQTAEEVLSTEHKVITPDDIAVITHQTLKNFDELAAVQYAAKHHLIASVRRRGRPSLSPSERVPRTDASPSE